MNHSQKVAGVGTLATVSDNGNSGSFYLELFSKKRANLVDTIRNGGSKRQEGIQIREMWTVFKTSTSQNLQHKDSVFISASFYRLKEISETVRSFFAVLIFLLLLKVLVYFRILAF